MFWIWYHEILYLVMVNKIYIDPQEDEENGKHNIL